MCSTVVRSLMSTNLVDVGSMKNRYFWEGWTVGSNSPRRMINRLVPTMRRCMNLCMIQEWASVQGRGRGKRQREVLSASVPSKMPGLICLPSSVVMSLTVCIFNTVLASLRMTWSQSENPASLATSIRYRSRLRCSPGIHKPGICTCALQLSKNCHNCLTKTSCTRCVYPLYGRDSNWVPLPTVPPVVHSLTKPLVVTLSRHRAPDGCKEWPVCVHWWRPPRRRFYIPQSLMDRISTSF